MRTTRRLAAVALAGLIVLAGCSDDDGDEGAGSTTTTEAAADDTTDADGDESTTTTADDGGDDEGDGEDGSTTTEAGGSTETTAPDTAGEGQEGTGAPDAEQPDVSWDLNAVEHRGEDGSRIAYLCPPDGELAAVWGTETYTDDSSVCSAAVHAGLINPIEGGRVIIEIAPGEDSYEGTEANGVTSQDYAEWPGSFTFPVG